MKTQLLILAFFFYVGIAYAQPTFEHNFNNDYAVTHSFNAHNETMYNSYNDSTNTVTIYKGDFSLYKQITVTPPSGYHCIGLCLFSSKLFNTDSLLEFIAIFQDINPELCKMILYNENLAVITDFGNRSDALVFKTMDNQTKLNVFNCYWDPSSQTVVCASDIYKLPGTIADPNPSDVNNIIINKDSNFPYPNPATSFINLPFSLGANEISEMNIYNSSGQLVDRIQIQGTSNFLRLPLNKYTPGVYIYGYKGKSNKFIVK